MFIGLRSGQASGMSCDQRQANPKVSTSTAHDHNRGSFSCGSSDALRGSYDTARSCSNSAPDVITGACYQWSAAKPNFCISPRNLTCCNCLLPMPTLPLIRFATHSPHSRLRTLCCAGAVHWWPANTKTSTRAAAIADAAHTHSAASDHSSAAALAGADRLGCCSRATGSGDQR